MVDVNGLKGVNDRFGHEQGNLLLKHTVKTICDLFNTARYTGWAGMNSW